MLSLYTAIGYLKFEKGTNDKPMPMVVNNNQEYGVSDHELLVWSSLAFQILQIDELEAEYNRRLKLTNLPAGLAFSHYLNRLLLRGLIAKGEGMTGLDALYRLLGTLYIRPVKDTFSIRLFSCIHLYLEGKIKHSDFGRYLKKEKLTAIEETILKLVEKTPLSVGELLASVEKGVSISSEKDVMDQLYQNPEVTYQSLAGEAQVHHIQLPVMQAVGNLYLNKQISFQTF